MSRLMWKRTRAGRSSSGVGVAGGFAVGDGDGGEQFPGPGSGLADGQDEGGQDARSGHLDGEVLDRFDVGAVGVDQRRLAAVDRETQLDGAGRGHRRSPGTRFSSCSSTSKAVSNWSTSRSSCCGGPPRAGWFGER
jgi:hypothetical protein